MIDCVCGGFVLGSIIDESSKEAAVVDPVEAEKVVEVAKQHGVLLKFVLTTHHHWYGIIHISIPLFEYFCLFTLFGAHNRDHAGGNEKIKQLVPGIKVYGGSVDNVKGCTDKLENGDNITLGAHLNILSLHTPWYICFFNLFPLLFVLYCF